MDGPPALGRIRGDVLDRVDRRLGALELLPILDDGARLIQPFPELFGARIDRLDLDPPGWSPPDRSPQGDEPNGDASGQEREAAVHRADATLPPASCPALRRDPTRRSRAWPPKTEGRR
jgi:hypothetical protein